MKLKTIYILVLVCTISLFVSAKQRLVNVKDCCKLKQEESSPRVIKASRASFDLSPLSHFVFNI